MKTLLLTILLAVSTTAFSQSTRTYNFVERYDVENNKLVNTTFGHTFTKVKTWVEDGKLNFVINTPHQIFHATVVRTEYRENGSILFVDNKGSYVIPRQDSFTVVFKQENCETKFIFFATEHF